MKLQRLFLLGCLFALLAGCATTHHRYKIKNDGAPHFHIDVSKIPNAVPKIEPFSKYGNPPSYVACGHRYYVSKSYKGYDEKGIASWYGMKFYKFRTSSGEMYDVAGMTAAHKTLPLPTYAQVTNLQNGRQVIVKINDRGPFVSNRLIDLSYAAAVKLGVYPKGTGLVEVKAIDPRCPSRVLSVTPKVRAADRPQLYLQVGAFANRQNAVCLVPKVRQWTSAPVTVKTSNRKGKPLYHVEIGPLPSVENSDALYRHLGGAGLGKPITIVQ